MCAPFSWTDQHSWPRGVSGHVFLAEALDQVGHRLKSESWTGHEPIGCIGGPPALVDGIGQPYVEIPEPPPPALYAIGHWNAKEYARSVDEYKHQDAARARHEAQEKKRLAVHKGRVRSWNRLCCAMDWIRIEGAEGRLITRGRHVAGGDYFDLSRSIWNIENLWQTRFSTCQFIYERVPTYIFFTRQSLDKRLRDFDRAAGTSGAVIAVEDWLIEEFARPGTKSKPKGEFREEALRQFRVSGRGFDRAWERASDKYPERRQAGRKPE